jgi:hypothetical protein
MIFQKILLKNTNIIRTMKKEAIESRKKITEILEKKYWRLEISGCPSGRQKR